MLTRKQEETIAAARRILLRGEKLTSAILGRELGVHPDTAMSRVRICQRDGLWPYPVARLKAGRVEGQSCQLNKGGLFAEHDAEVKDRARAVLEENYVGMIDGRDELDDTPVGMPPRHGKAFDEMRGRKFDAHPSPDYQRPYHHATRNPSIYNR